MKNFYIKATIKYKKVHIIQFRGIRNAAIVMTVVFVIERLMGTVLSLLGDESGSVYSHNFIALPESTLFWL